MTTRDNLRRGMPAFAFRNRVSLRPEPNTSITRVFFREFPLNYERIPRHSTEARGKIRLPRFFPIHVLRRQIIRLAVCELIVASTANHWRVVGNNQFLLGTIWGFGEQDITSFTRREKYAMPHSRLLIVKRLDLISINQWYCKWY